MYDFEEKLMNYFFGRVIHNTDYNSYAMYCKLSERALYIQDTLWQWLEHEKTILLQDPKTPQQPNTFETPKYHATGSLLYGATKWTIWCSIYAGYMLERLWDLPTTSEPVSIIHVSGNCLLLRRSRAHLFPRPDPHRSRACCPPASLQTSYTKAAVLRLMRFFYSDFWFSENGSGLFNGLRCFHTTKRHSIGCWNRGGFGSCWVNTPADPPSVKRITRHGLSLS